MDTMMMPTRKLCFLLCILYVGSLQYAHAQHRLKIAVAGLSHDHVHPLLNAYRQGEVTLLGVAESDTGLMLNYQRRYGLPDSICFPTVKAMLQSVKPDVMLAYNAISEHVEIAEACLPMRIPLMVEKPLATTNDQARRIAALAEKYDTPVWTNYETTWYTSNQELKKLVGTGAVGRLKKIVVRDGHQGPKEIGCSEAFLAWLTDPEKNGGGALMDFGCYGANLITWLMNGERPVAVTAVTRQLKPDKYPYVDDDATVILEYAGGLTGVLQASWDWPYSIKDIQVFGDSSSLHAVDAQTVVHYRSPGDKASVPVTDDFYDGHLSFLKAVLDGVPVSPHDPSSLANNLVVVEILAAARESAKRGTRVELE